MTTIALQHKEGVSTDTVGLLAVGEQFPDFELLDHAGNRRRLSDLVGGDPTVVQFYRGWWCPKEQAFFRRLLALQEDAEVAYSRILSVSVDPPEVNAAFRAGLGARWTFLSDPDRDLQMQLRLRETTDTLNDPYVPAVVVVDPDLRVRSIYNGYWYWGRPTQDELVTDLREISRAVRADWQAPDAMSRCWLALTEGPVEGAQAFARASTLDGQEVGALAAWRLRAKPVHSALRVDDRLIDPAGGAAWISLVLAPPGVRLPFDDLAVQQARRLVLSRPPLGTVSTLLRDNSHFEGAITVAPQGAERWLHEDPFARIFPPRLLAVDAGVLGSVPAPTGPTIERYGSDNPWPWDRFD